MVRTAGRIARVTCALGRAAALLALVACSDGDHRGDGRSRVRDAAGTVKSDPGRSGAGGPARSATPTGSSGAAAAPVWGFASFAAPDSPPGERARGGPGDAECRELAHRRRDGRRRAGHGRAAADRRLSGDLPRHRRGRRARRGDRHRTGPGRGRRRDHRAGGLLPRRALGRCRPGRAGRPDLSRRRGDAGRLRVHRAVQPRAGHRVPGPVCVCGRGAYAYLRSDAASAATSRPANAYSVSGPGTIEVHRVGAGHYTIDLTGPAFAKNGNNLQVNAIGDGPVGCNALGRVVNKDRQSVFVGCARGSAWTDSPFVLLYTSGQALIPTGAASFGHAFTGIIRPGEPVQPVQPVPPGPPVNAWAWYSANSSGAANRIGRIGVGRYQVSFPGVSGIPSSFQVTPYGEPTARCVADELPVAAIGGAAPADVTVAVRCVDAAGRPADSYASVAYVSASAPLASRPPGPPTRPARTAAPR